MEFLSTIVMLSLSHCGYSNYSQAAYPDWTAWDPADPHFDPKTDPQNTVVYG